MSVLVLAHFFKYALAGPSPSCPVPVRVPSTTVIGELDNEYAEDDGAFFMQSAARRNVHGRSGCGSEPDSSKCRENGAYDSDCCARSSEWSCADGYVPVARGEYCWGTEYEYYDCYPPDQAPATTTTTTHEGQPDSSKCRENGAYDSDCCARPSETSCADGYVPVGRGEYCWGTEYEYYDCYPPDHAPTTTTTTTQEGQPDSSKCRENGAYDSDCCARPSETSCADGYVPVGRGEYCWGTEYEYYDCYHPDHAPTTTTSTTTTQAIQPDPSKCLENGAYDSDCCAKSSEWACADGYVPVASGVYCYGNEYEIVHCYPPDKVPSAAADPSMCRDRTLEDRNCCASESQAGCHGGYTRIMTGSFCNGEAEYFQCYPPGSFSHVGTTTGPTTTTTTTTLPPNDWPARTCDAGCDGCACAKQGNAHCAQCIPCNVFSGGRKCQRDATVIASMVFTPWHLCYEGGACDNDFRSTQICRRTIGKIARQCWAFNNGRFLPHDGPQGFCISIAMKAYAEHNMAMNRKNVDDFKNAFQWSHGERFNWGDRPDAVMYTCEDFCEGWGEPTGELGACGCACKKDAVQNWTKSERCTTIKKGQCKNRKWCSGNGKAIAGKPLDRDETQVPCSCECKEGYRGERCEIPPESQQCEAVTNCNGHGFPLDTNKLTPGCGCDCVCWHGDACQSPTG